MKRFQPSASPRMQFNRRRPQSLPILVALTLIIAALLFIGSSTLRRTSSPGSSLQPAVTQLPSTEPPAPSRVVVVATAPQRTPKPTEDPDFIASLKKVVIHLVAIGDSLTSGLFHTVNLRQTNYVPYATFAAEQLRKRSAMLYTSGVKAVEVSAETHGYPGRTSDAVLAELSTIWASPSGGTNAKSDDDNVDGEQQDRRMRRRAGRNAEIPHVAVCSVMVGTNDILRKQATPADFGAVIENTKRLHRKCVQSHRLFGIGLQKSARARSNLRNASAGVMAAAADARVASIADRFDHRRAPLVIVSLVLKVLPMRFDFAMRQNISERIGEFTKGNRTSKRAAYCLPPPSDEQSFLATLSSVNDAIADHVHTDLITESVAASDDFLDRRPGDPPVHWHVAKDVVDFNDVLSAWKSSGANKAADAMKRWSDCVHPDAVGYRAIGNRVAEAIAASLFEVLKFL